MQIDQRQLPDGSVVEVAIGELCFVCGSTLNAFLPDTPEKIADRLANEKGFVDLFERVRSNHRERQERLLRGSNKSVSSQSGMGMRMIRELAFIQLDKFRTHFHVLPENAKEKEPGGIKIVKMVSLRGIEGIPMKGVLLDPDTIPESAIHPPKDSTTPPLRWDKVELYYYSDRLFEECFLEPDLSFRPQQAEDLFTYMCGQVSGTRTIDMRGTTITAASYDDVKKEADEFQRNLMLPPPVAATTAAPISRSSLGTFGSDVVDTEAPQGPTPRYSKAPGGAKAGSGGKPRQGHGGRGSAASSVSVASGRTKFSSIGPKKTWATGSLVDQAAGSASVRSASVRSGVSDGGISTAAGGSRCLLSYDHLPSPSPEKTKGPAPGSTEPEAVMSWVKIMFGAQPGRELIGVFLACLLCNNALRCPGWCVWVGCKACSVSVHCCFYVLLCSMRFLSCLCRCMFVQSILCQIKNTIADLEARIAKGEDVQLQLDEAVDVQNAVQACKELVAENLEGMSLVDIHQKACFLKLVQVDVPLFHKIIITRKRGQWLLSESEIECWVEVAVPDRANEVLRIKGKTVARWTVKDAAFTLVVRALAEKEVAEDTPEFKKLCEEWPSTVLCSKIWQLLAKAVTCKNSVQYLIKIIRQYFKGIERLMKPEQELDWPETFRNVFLAINRVLRGVAMMLSPIPGECGATIDDVLYTMPRDSSRAQVLKDLPRLGRALNSRLHKDQQFWEDARGYAEQYFGADAKNVPIMKALTKALADAAVACGAAEERGDGPPAWLDAADVAFDMFEKQYGAIVESVREDGDSEVRQCAETCFRVIFKAVMELGPLQEWGVKALKRTADCVGQLDAEALLTEISDHITVHQTSDRMSQALDALNSLEGEFKDLVDDVPFTNFDNIAAAVLSLKKCPTRTKELTDALYSATLVVITTLGKQNVVAVDSGLEHLLQFLQLSTQPDVLAVKDFVACFCGLRACVDQTSEELDRDPQRPDRQEECSRTLGAHIKTATAAAAQNKMPKNPKFVLAVGKFSEGGCAKYLATAKSVLERCMVAAVVNLLCNLVIRMDKLKPVAGGGQNRQCWLALKPREETVMSWLGKTLGSDQFDSAGLAEAIEDVKEALISFSHMLFVRLWC